MDHFPEACVRCDDVIVLKELVDIKVKTLLREWMGRNLSASGFSERKSTANMVRMVVGQDYSFDQYHFEDSVETFLLVGEWARRVYDGDMVFAQHPNVGMGGRG